eukprot:14109_1
MTHYQIILLHHDPSLVYSVLDQFEDGVMDEQRKQYGHEEFYVKQSKRKLASFITSVCILNGDVSRLIVDFAPPPLVIMNEKKYYGNDTNSDSYLLSFHDRFVEFDKMSLLQFACANFKSCKYEKTCFIQLFDEKEAKPLGSIHEMATVYSFLTRLFGASFETSHHIHLFAKHKGTTTSGDLWLARDNQLKHHQLASFSSLKILSHLLSTIIDKNKIPPMMAMYSLISKIRLRLNVVREIRSLSSDMTDLVNHILTTNRKHTAYSALRTSYVSTHMNR